MSFPRYPAYKDSGVEWLGDVPQHWEVVRVRWLCEIKKRIVGELGFDVLSITQRGIRIKDTESNDGQLSMDYSKYQLVEVGDFAMNHMDLLTGYVDISPVQGVTSPDYRVFSLRDPVRCHAKFFLYLFQNGYLNKVFYPFGQGSSQLGRWRLPTEQFNDFWFPVPSFEEQSAIAAFVDHETAKIDALVAEQERLIELLKEKRQAVISHAVTKGLDPSVPMKDSGMEWLGEVPAHWSRPMKLQDLGCSDRHAFVNGPFGSDLLAEELVTDGVPVIYIRDIRPTGYTRISPWCVTEEKAAQLAFCNVISDDILIAKVGDPPGLAVVYPRSEPSAVVTQDVIRLRVDQGICSPHFVRFLLNSDFGQSLVDDIAVESTRKRVGLGDYKGLRIVLPPLAEQAQIVSVLNEALSKWDVLLETSTQAIQLLRERRTALISAAVTGQIDVRGWVPAETAH